MVPRVATSKSMRHDVGTLQSDPFKSPTSSPSNYSNVLTLRNTSVQLREEPDAGKPHVRICEGKAEWPSYSTASDISLSTTKKYFPSELVLVNNTGLDSCNVELQSPLLRLFKEAGFAVNDKKTRLHSKFVRQEITGLTVNEFVNVPRKYVRQIRAMIHAASKHGLESAGREYVLKYAPQSRISAEVLGDEGFDVAAYFLNVIYGKLAFLRMVRGDTDRVYINLCLRMDDIDENPPKSISEIISMHEEFDVFISHASEDKESVARPLHNALIGAGINSFIDEEYIGWGDSFVEIINHALGRSKLVVFVLSNNSCDKGWPRKELFAALAREIEGDTKILPLMVGTKADIKKFRRAFALLSDKLYEEWQGSADGLVTKIMNRLS